MELSSYFKTHLEKFKESHTNTIESLLQTVLTQVKSQLLQSSLAISDKRKRFKPKPINSPKTEEPVPDKPKYNKHEREEFFKEHQKKVDETKEFTKKLITERFLREKRQQEKDDQLRMKADKDIEEQRRKQEEIQKRLEEEKQKKLNEMIQKSELRKKQIEELKEQITTKKPSQKPLYKQMEDNYKQQVLLPSLEQQKAELAKKRIQYQPINIEEIKEHSKKHEEIKREQEYKRKKELEQRNLEAQVNLVSNSLQSKFTAAVLEEEKLKKEEKIRAEMEKKANLLKKQQYAKLVKEMFPPIVNESKKFEFDDKKKTKKSLRPAKSGQHSREASIAVIKTRPGDYKSELGEPKVPKRKWKENKMIKKPEAKKEVKIVDYLLDRRNANKERAGSIEPIEIDLEKELVDEEFNEQKVKRIKAKAEKLEKVAQQKERLLGIGKVDSYKNLQAGDQVNDMILASIKTKLALLDKFTAKN